MRAAHGRALVALVGYAFDTRALYDVFVFTAMALHTAVLFVFVFAAILLLAPGRSWVAILVGRGPGSVGARRLLPLVALAPCPRGCPRGCWACTRLAREAPAAAPPVVLPAVAVAVAVPVVVVPGRKNGSAPPPAGEPPVVPKHMRSIIQMSYGAMKSSIGVIDAYLYERIHWQPER